MVSIAFVCVHNAGRSQMAAAFARHLAPPGTTVISGGTNPATQLNATVVQAMLEKGIDLRSISPRRLGYDEAMAADFFITMGCSPDEACPAGYRGDVRDWDLPDPKGLSLDQVRRIRDEIEVRVRDLFAEIARSTSGPPRKGGSR